MTQTVKVKIDRIYSSNQVIRDWKYIYSHAEENSFLSWPWISAWLNSVLPSFKIYACVASKNGSPVGIGLFAEVYSRRYKILKTKQWWLHKTGHSELDQVWIEHNDFLLDKRFSESVRKVMWDCILSSQKDVDEFILGLSNRDVIEKHQNHLMNYLRWDFIESTGWEVELSKYADFESYRMSRSKNFRSQMKRVEKILEERNAVVTIGNSIDSFKEGLNISAPWHKKQWKGESGFHNSEFNEYLKQFYLESESSDSSRLFTLKVEMDDVPIAICLGFYTSGTLYFYLSAQQQITDNKLKIGLYMHYRAIKWCFQNKMSCYDFLAGDYRYKRSFSNRSTDFYLTHFQKDKFKFKCEKKLKDIKRKIQRN